jgi:hypothetical protein
MPKNEFRLPAHPTKHASQSLATTSFGTSNSVSSHQRIANKETKGWSHSEKAAGRVGIVADSWSQTCAARNCCSNSGLYTHACWASLLWQIHILWIANWKLVWQTKRLGFICTCVALSTCRYTQYQLVRCFHQRLDTHRCSFGVCGCIKRNHTWVGNEQTGSEYRALQVAAGQSRHLYHSSLGRSIWVAWMVVAYWQD